MTDRARARAHANIALVKYWGKIPGTENAPATPSISLALDALTTVTEVRRLPSGPDRVELNGRPAEGETRRRVTAFLDLWRGRGLLSGPVAVSTENRFPTASGLASSASGYAALTLALAGLSPRRLDRRALSRLARRGSGSAARSVPGGLAALPLGEDPAARTLLRAEEVPWGMVIALVEGGMKAVGSREGMERSRETSPYYTAWVRQSRRDYRRMLAAVRRRDLGEVGEIAEANALAMHACMLSTRPALVYWSGGTLALLNEVRRWRADGLETYATIDAGAHVMLLARREDLPEVARRARGVEGVRSVLTGYPGGAAEVIR